MGFNNKYPYTDFHELNLDWILDKISGIDARFESIESDIAALQRDNQALGARVSAIDERLDKLFDSIAPEYDESDTYIEGSFAWHNDKLYQANENTTGQWDELDWDEVQISEILFNMERDLDTLRTRVSTMAASLDKFDSIAEDYDETLSYQFDQYVFYLNELYRCVTIGGTTPGAFNVSDWVQTSVGHELDQNFQNITSIAYALADPFDALTTYNAGDYVSYNNSVYKALQTVTGVLPSSGAPNWSQVQVMEEISSGGAGLDVEKHTATLTAGSTTLTWTPNDANKTVLQVFTDTFGVNPSNITYSAGTFTVTFPAQASDVSVVMTVFEP